MKYAPVIIPTLCRSRHFIRLMESLKRNPWARYTEVYVGLDFPSQPRHRVGWEEIGRYLAESDLSAFKAVHVSRRASNAGVLGNTRLLREEATRGHDRWIVLADDLEVAPCFLEYIDRCMERYDDAPEVVAVCGYTYPVRWDVSPGATCLLQSLNAAEWGTGYWVGKSERVQEYMSRREGVRALPRVLAQRLWERMIDPCRREYFTDVCSPWLRGRSMVNRFTDIGLRCYLAVTGARAVSPVVSKVRNHGFDGSGEYCGVVDATLRGDTAGTYDYAHQPLDTAETFALVEDTRQSDDENFRRLNRFDGRTRHEMRHTRRMIWLCRHTGLWGAEAYSLALFMCVLPGKVWRKIRR